MKIIKFLKELINDGWKQVDIAKKCNYSASHINRLIKRNYADIKTIEKIAKAFDKPILMFLEEEQPAGRVLSREEEILLDICDKDRELIREMIRCAQKEKLFRDSVKEEKQGTEKGRVAG